MSEQLARRIEGLKGAAQRGLFARIRRGIEKEGLRVDQQGNIEQTPHPRALGSKLTHPHITTDYSEALLEYITPVFCRPQDALDFLADLHRFTYRYLGDELIWPASMPARLNGNDSVPIADYGSSNVGAMKHVYRRGLDVRYGRIMQSIAGIHYNFSLPDALWSELQQLEGESEASPNAYRSRAYFDLIRNFRRNSWLLMYLFGASPAIDRSFLEGRDAGLEHHGERTLLSSTASTLRMSDLGYQNKVQSQLRICFNSLENYVGTLRHAIATPWPDYERLGVQQEGEWRQLNSNILQIENEYYSDIRPKRVARHDETSTQALEARGVEYIEVRCLDLDPFLPLGIDETEIRFLDTFLVWCLLRESPWIPDAECDRLDDNRARVVRYGRQPGLTLEFEDGPRLMSTCAHEILDELASVAQLLDSGDETAPHQTALKTLAPRIDDPGLTPAGRLERLLREQGCDFVDWVTEQARQQAEWFRATPMDRAREALLEQLSETSHIQQRDTEADDDVSFAEFLGRYFERARQPHTFQKA
ncbi:glutamate--cysteine ligase [Kushneria phosphatilytica]|uniref:Glutamate--cysteine ligase n=1 Tax=Kushneria phosphatilytica TaxID=657387 RepID=A0A1S1NW56_9GAMM|nr:glutamate--cysteine ligase [Kushneria phosphatilytica]OHV09712.1 glutamate--cysteine ligase [Kushneria phosphatilytica]QEL11758.1 glutamate--cysteine ligase [Kushneria phosphatilytica]